MCRTTDLTIDSVKQYLYKPLEDAGIKYQVYVHALTLDTLYTNSRNDESGFVNKNLCYLFEPAKIVAEDQNEVDFKLNLESYRTHGDPWGNSKSENFDSLNNHIRALYSLSRVTQLALQESHTALIFARPDVKFLSSFDVNWLSLKENDIRLPDFHEYFGVNDRFAVATPQTAAIYGLRFEDAKEYSLVNPLLSEAFLEYCLKKGNCNILKMRYRFRRIRVPCKEIDLYITP